MKLQHSQYIYDHFSLQNSIESFRYLLNQGVITNEAKTESCMLFSFLSPKKTIEANFQKIPKKIFLYYFIHIKIIPI